MGDCYQPGIDVTNKPACDAWCESPGNFASQGSGDTFLGVRCQCTDPSSGNLVKSCEGSYVTPDCQTAGLHSCEFEGSTCQALCDKYVANGAGFTCSENPQTCLCGSYYACQPTNYDDCGSTSIGVTSSASCNAWCDGNGSFLTFATVDLSQGRACGCEDINGAITKACVGAESGTKGAEKDDTTTSQAKRRSLLVSAATAICAIALQ